MNTERQLTFDPHGHLLSNIGVWSSDGKWIVYDVRSDPAGSRFDGTRIERVDVETGEVQVLFESQSRACCGVVTCSPVDDRVVFIHGPENPTADWSYSACHRRGVIARMSHPGVAENLDACDLIPPFTKGALRGGSHVHTFREDGNWVAFTYEDHPLTVLIGRDGADLNQRNIGVSIPDHLVVVPKSVERNHSGSHFSVLVTQTVNAPTPGSDEISRAFEEGWIPGRRAIGFEGNVLSKSGQAFTELFVVELPDDLTQDGDGPLQGTPTRRPFPPKGCLQRRLTFTESRRFPGIQGPRHWVRASPDGKQLACLMKDDSGVVQLVLVPFEGGEPRFLSSDSESVESAFSWSPDGNGIAQIRGGRVCLTQLDGLSIPLTEPDAKRPPRPEACVFSPDGSKIAYVRQIEGWNQIFVIEDVG